MTCKKCGADLFDSAAICPVCGTMVNGTIDKKEKKQKIKRDNKSHRNAHNSSTQSSEQIFLHDNINANNNRTTGSYAAPIGAYPMKWYKFLIYFALWAGAITSLSNAGNMMMIFGDDNPIGVIFMIGHLIAAVVSVIARFRLAKFRRNGPSMLILVYVINIILNIALTVFINSMSYYGSVSTNLAPYMIWNIILIIANKKYFRRRAAMFYR